MAKYTEDAKALLEYVGGTDNIQAVTHCVTRMRFVLFDEKKADVERIEEIPSVKGTFTQSVSSRLLLEMMFSCPITILLKFQVLKVFLKRH